MSRHQRQKENKKFQFIAIVLITAIATIWLALLGNYVWKQLAPVNQLSDRPAADEASQPVPSAPVPVTPLPADEPPQPPVATSPRPSKPAFTLPDNPPIQTSPPPAGAPPKFNHLPYDQASGNLVEVGTYYDRSELLVDEVAQAFWRMADVAKTAGINLGPISGFRTVGDQRQLFERQISRQNGSEEAAARLSAPPGYSEHHTGYTIDIRDRDEPDTDLKYAMENTQAYQWLRENACQYGFELSFPDNNQQGVSFEPWHWRYIASPTAQQIFANAHQRYPAPTNCSVF